MDIALIQYKVKDNKTRYVCRALEHQTPFVSNVDLGGALLELIERPGESRSSRVYIRNSSNIIRDSGPD